MERAFVSETRLWARTLRAAAFERCETFPVTRQFGSCWLTSSSFRERRA